MWPVSRRRAAAIGSADPQEGAQNWLSTGDGGGVATASGVAAASGAAMTGSAAGDKIWKRYSMGDIDLDDEAIGEVDEDRAELRGELWAL